MVLRNFSKLFRKGIVSRGNRPVFWSVEKQKIMSDEEMVLQKELTDCAVMKLPIKRFGKKSR